MSETANFITRDNTFYEDGRLPNGKNKKEFINIFSIFLLMFTIISDNKILNSEKTKNLTLSKAYLLSKFCWGTPSIPASEFLDTQNANEILSLVTHNENLSNDQKSEVVQFITNFVNWNSFADAYMAHYASQVWSSQYFSSIFSIF